jgi:hypothetical protein
MQDRYGGNVPNNGWSGAHPLNCPRLAYGGVSLNCSIVRTAQ